jgi:signal transduction histidine kinase
MASEVHADALALLPEPISLRTTLLAAVDRILAAHPVARITVEVEQDVEFVADPARLGQALDNLLENAIRHGRPPVRLTGEPSEDGVRVLVSDDGPGVEQRLADRLFERFAHAGSAGSTGLGLHLVREIARSHGGEASYLAPEAGRRTTFTLELPNTPRIPGV